MSLVYGTLPRDRRMPFDSIRGGGDDYLVTALPVTRYPLPVTLQSTVMYGTDNRNPDGYI